jgi:polyketide cyclase/dehydrase/lipid transport protein
MSRIAAQRVIAGAQPHDVAALWWDTARWPSFVEGFSHVRKREEPWPEAGGRLVWDARPESDRGRVIEHVLRRDAAGAEVAMEDARLQGTQRVAFTPARDGTLVALELEYTLKGSAAAIVDLAYVRRRLTRGLERTLERLGREVDMERELAAGVD